MIYAPAVPRTAGAYIKLTGEVSNNQQQIKNDTIESIVYDPAEIVRDLKAPTHNEVYKEYIREKYDREYGVSRTDAI